jgi:ATP-dependent Clp protease protease subunit
MAIIPTVIEVNSDSERHYDIFSLLLKERIIMLSGEINDDTATLVVSQLLYLSSIDNKKDISIYINSPGGSVTAGMAIYDTMQLIDNDIKTICVGLAASMGAFLLSGGTKGKRYALPNSEIMIHQPLGGVKGQVTDIEILTKRLSITKKNMNKILAINTGKDEKTIEQDTERDNFMSAIEALKYGLIDKVITKKESY